MRRWFAVRWLLLSAILVFRSSWAATIFVDANLSSATCVTYNPATRSCAGGLDLAFRTIAGANAVVIPGTVVLIRVGVYLERLNPVSGLLGLPVTYQAYQGESVRIGNQSASSRGIEFANGQSWIVIDGLRVEHQAWVEARGTRNITLRNCVFLDNPNGGTTGNVRFISAFDTQIINCQIIDGHDNLILIDCNRTLVQGCTIGDGVHSVLSIRCSDFTIIRSNYFYNALQKIGEIYDCDVTQTTALTTNSFDSTSHNLFEDNVFAGAILGPRPEYSDTTSNGNGIQWAAQDSIARRNIFTDCNIGISAAWYTAEAQHDDNNRFYANVFYRNKGGGLNTRPGNADNKFKNNILLLNGGCIGGCTDGTNPGQIVYREPAATAPFGTRAIFENNTLFYQSPGQAILEQEFASSGRTLAQFNSTYPGALVNTLEVDPQFVTPTTNHPSADNFRLQTGSPMIDTGAFLTRTTASAGSGFTLPVLDAFYFYDGFGIAGQQGDLIQLEGQTQIARILSVNYAANTLTLDQPLAWTANQGVSLPYNGAAPDRGLAEFASEIRLNFSLNGPSFNLTWPPSLGYQLLSSTNVAGPFDPIAGPNGTYSETIAGPAKFFQLRKPN